MNVHVLEPGVSVCQALFMSRKEPLVVKDQLNSWIQSGLWTPKELCKILGNKTAMFKICARRGTPAFHRHFREKEVVFETQCKYEVTTFRNLFEWLDNSCLEWQEGSASGGGEPPTSSHKRLKVDPLQSGKSTVDTRSLVPSDDNAPASSSERQTSPLTNYSKTDYWIYADYKYMVHLFEDLPDVLSSVNWSMLGFTDRGGKDSTLWIGSEGANTPCHYDTYGCNFVAQLYGRKKWTLFSPRDSDKLYPTRVPYEESSVFSQVDVADPDLIKYPLFAEAKAHEVVVHIWLNFCTRAGYS